MITHEKIRYAVSQGWCWPENSDKEFDSDLADAIAHEVRGMVDNELKGLLDRQTYAYTGKDGKTILARDLEDQRDALAARIEELEAKLKKAVGALGDVYDGEEEWPDDPKKELDWCRNRARAALAEIGAGQ
jgi:hypothetical protein